MTDLPVVSLWADTGAEWRVVGDLPAYSDLDLQIRHNDAGPWSITVPWDAKAAVADTNHLVTFDWRGRRIMTGVVNRYVDGVDEDGQPYLTLSGLDALAYIGYSTAWPRPAQGLSPPGTQSPWDPNAAPPIRDFADAAVLKVVRDNLLTRRAQTVSVAADHSLGSTISIRPAFDNLLELALRKARRGGIGLSVGIAYNGLPNILGNYVNTTGLLTVTAYQPVDRSVQIVFDTADGSMGSWSRTKTAPTATRAIVSGVQGKYRSTSRQSESWLPNREQFVQGPASFDDVELDQAADEALDAGQPGVNIEVVAAETARQQAFLHYNVGDVASARLRGTTVVDTITAISVKVDDGGPTVTPMFGDPDGIDPRNAHAKLVRRTRRDVDQQKRRT